MNKDITIVITTDWIPSSPNTQFVESSLESIYHSYPSLRDCRVLVYYNRHDGNNGEKYRRPPNPYIDKPLEEDPYYNNLVTLSKHMYPGHIEVYGFDNDFEKLDYQQAGALKRALDTITTPYMIWLQHDWTLHKNKVDNFPMDKILEVFDKYEHVNYMSWNYRWNKVGGYDKIIKQDTEIKEMDLCKATRWSNNPYIARVSKFHDSWAKMVLRKENLQHLGKAGNIEAALWGAYRNEFKHNFEKAHKRWGIYLFGKPGEGKDCGAFFSHTNGRKKGYVKNGAEFIKYSNKISDGSLK